MIHYSLFLWFKIRSLSVSDVSIQLQHHNIILVQCLSQMGVNETLTSWSCTGNCSKPTLYGRSNEILLSSVLCPTAAALCKAESQM